MLHKSIGVQAIGIFIISLLICSSASAVKITVWDQYTAPDMSPAVDKLNALFEKANPDIQIERVAMSGEDMRKVLKTALLAGEKLDVVYTEVGPGHMGLLARAGLLIDLTEVYERYGWTERVYEFPRTIATFDGKIWGIGNELEYLTTYYNKDVFQELGLEIPNSYEELIWICEKLKSKGYIPFGFASKDYWTSVHPFAVFVNLLIPKDELDEILLEKDKWDHPGLARALEIWSIEFPQKGYFSKDFQALGYNDGNMLFYTEKAPMRLTGTWLLGDIMENVKTFEPSSFLFPQIKKDIPVRVPMVCGSGYCVPKATLYPEECFKYLDFLLSDEAGKIWIEEAKLVPPFPVSLEGLELAPLQKDVIRSLFEIDGGHFIDIYSTARWWNELCSLMQGIYAGKETVDGTINKLNRIWKEEREKGLLRSR